MQLLFKCELWELLKFEHEIVRSGMQIIIQMINVFICMLKGVRGRESILISPVNVKYFIIC